MSPTGHSNAVLIAKELHNICEGCTTCREDWSGSWMIEVWSGFLACCHGRISGDDIGQCHAMSWSLARKLTDFTLNWWIKFLLMSFSASTDAHTTGDVWISIYLWFHLFCPEKRCARCVKLVKDAIFYFFAPAWSSVSLYLGSESPNEEGSNDRRTEPVVKGASTETWPKRGIQGNAAVDSQLPCGLRIAQLMTWLISLTFYIATCRLSIPFHPFFFPASYHELPSSLRMSVSRKMGDSTESQS